MRLRVVELCYCILGMVLELVCHRAESTATPGIKARRWKQEVKSKDIRADQKLRDHNMMNRSWDCLGFPEWGRARSRGGEGGVGVVLLFFASNASHQFVFRVFQPLLFGFGSFVGVFDLVMPCSTPICVFRS